MTENVIGVSHYDELDNVWITCVNFEGMGGHWGHMSTIIKFQKYSGRFSNMLGTFTYKLGKCEERFYNIFITFL